MAIKGRNNHILLSFSFFVLITGLSYSQTDELLQGQLLKDEDGHELVSAYGNFRLGFFSRGGTTHRYLGIWYHKPTERSIGFDYDAWPTESNLIVWVANRNNPISDRSGCLTIDSNGNLTILHKGGDPIVISSVQRSGNTTAALLKTGNFVLYEMNSDGSKGRELWQSFDYPTDTLLPGMKLGLNLQTGQTRFLQSWSSSRSPARGSYTLGMHKNFADKLVMWKGKEVVGTSTLLQNKYFNFSWSEYYIRYNFSYSSDEQGRYLRYSVNEDVTSFPMLKIDPYGFIVDDTSIDFSFPTMFDGCISYEENSPACPSLYRYCFQVNHGLMAGEGFKFPESANMTIGDCGKKCWSSCSCVAFSATNKYNNTGCQIWSREIEFIPSYGNKSADKIYLLVEQKDFAGGAKEKWWPKLVIAVGVALAVCLLLSLGYHIRRKYYKDKEEKQWISLVIVIGVASVVPVLCYVCFLLLKKLKSKVESTLNRQKLLHELGHNVSLPTIFGKRKPQAGQAKDQSIKRDLKIFDFPTIAAATDNFSTENRLGQGGFGPVYKGKLLDGQEIAIKRLSKSSGQGIVEFKNEAKLIAKLQHTNLVRLVGCSLQGGERLLVYEYMPNKSLDYFIFDSSRKNLLNWKKRFNIIEGIVQGLLYLHKYSRLKVIHRDLKASNILLDDQMNPKISDFGMARTFAMNELEANTNRIVGTHGYMSPEYVMNGIVSMKSDVYSFGVLVLEIISSKKNNSSYDTERPLNLVGYAWQLWNEGKGLELIDSTMGESCSPNEVLRCIHVGLLCVQDRATDRPTMSDVVSMITNDTMALPAPKQPAFFINISSDYQEPEVTEIKLELCSVNDVTISGMEAR